MGKNLVKCKKIQWRHLQFESMMSYNCHVVVVTFNNVESLHCLFVFESTELKFGVRGNFGLLISNFNSKTQYQFEILRKMPLFFFSTMIFSPALSQEFVTMGTIIIFLQFFNFKRYYK